MYSTDINIVITDEGTVIVTFSNPILDTRIGVLLAPPLSMTLLVTPLDYETVWTGELWSKTNPHKWQN